MSDIEIRRAHMPAVTAGLTPGFLGLAGRLATLTAAALVLKEGMWVLRQRMERDAKHVDDLAEMCVVAEVEPQFTTLIHEAARALRDVADDSADLANAADEMEVNARATADAHESEYRGVYEAVNGSGVRQAKPGFYRSR